MVKFLGLADREPELKLAAINRRRAELSVLPAGALQSAAAAIRQTHDVVETFALTAVVAERVLRLRMFDVQLLGAIALQRGHIAEMQTGEGKTLAAVPAVVWLALHGRGVHVLTANDYLARRDATWMGEIYRYFGLSVSHLNQRLPADARRQAYLADVTYATANEVGFDCLRDGLARDPAEIVQRPFTFAVIDEVDSILIDEARIPLVIAGGVSEDLALARHIDSLVSNLRPGLHYFAGEFARNVQLSDAGIRRLEHELACDNLYGEESLRILTAVQDALHAHALLKRDVDYLVKNGSIELVDEFKGRIARDRRWPAGLQTALEAKERLPLKAQGRILGAITLQNLVGMYQKVCGMTGTAATQAEEFWKVYKLPVTVIPPNRSLIRRDLPDILYADKEARNQALVKAIAAVHETGRPVLVGTASVEDSERLSRHLELAAIPHAVLNARNDEAEAEIVAQAGALRAVTISTNMAGRGTDILLGGNPPVDREKVVELGGLCVFGTTRHEARRIDNQLRGRAGRQGDPGSSRFLISLQDDLLVRFGVAENPDIESVQRTAESQNFEIRQTLWKYESVIELHRHEVVALRREILLSPSWSIAAFLPAEQYHELSTSLSAEALTSAGRRVALAIIDDLWADYLANVAELRGGIHWVSYGGRNPLYEFLTGVREIYEDLQRRLPEEITETFHTAEIIHGQLRFPNEEKLERGATWTYLTTDQPFGTYSERIAKGLRRKYSRR